MARFWARYGSAMDHLGPGWAPIPGKPDPFGERFDAMTDAELRALAEQHLADGGNTAGNGRSCAEMVIEALDHAAEGREFDPWGEG